MDIQSLKTLMEINAMQTLGSVQSRKILLYFLVF